MHAWRVESAVEQRVGRGSTAGPVVTQNSHHVRRTLGVIGEQLGPSLPQATSCYARLNTIAILLSKAADRQAIRNTSSAANLFDRMVMACGFQHERPRRIGHNKAIVIRETGAFQAAGASLSIGL